MSVPDRPRPIDLRGELELRGSSGCVNVKASGAAVSLDVDSWDLLGRLGRSLWMRGAEQRSRALDHLLQTLQALDLQVAIRIGTREIARLPARDASAAARLLGLSGVRIRAIDLLRAAYAILRGGDVRRAG